MDEEVEQLRLIIAQELDLLVDAVVDDRSLRSDLGMDSIAAINVLFAAESILGLTITPAELSEIDSISDIRRLLHSRRFR